MFTLRRLRSLPALQALRGGLGSLCILCASSCNEVISTIPTQPDATVIVHYRVIGQSNAMYEVDINGQPDNMPDQQGQAYLFIQVYSIENNRPNAVPFNLIDRNMYINNGYTSSNGNPGPATFDLDGTVHSPSPWPVPAGKVQTGLFLLYDTQVNGLSPPGNPALASSQIDWRLLYNSQGLPAGQIVVMIKDPPVAGGQVTQNTSQLNFPQ